MAAFAADNVEAWLQELSDRHPHNIELGLTRTETVRAALNLTLPMPTAVVGGTNGKGSVCAFLTAILCEGGVRTGCYTSPHLLHFNERICIDGEMVDDKTLLSAFAKIEAAREACNISLTYFEFTTLAAAWIFAEVGVEAAVLEVGLGGRLDAVNVFPAAAAAVTNIGLDHQEFLGDTIDEIAYEKAGIFHPQRAAIIADTNAPPSLLAAAEKQQAIMYVAGRDFSTERAENGWHYRGRRDLFNLPSPAMRGAHQIANAAAAIAILENMSADLWPGIGAVRQGLHAAAAMGRAQVLPGEPLTILDVAHNAAAAMVLERMLFDMGYFSKTAAVLGMMARKDTTAFVRALSRRIDYWYIARPQGGDIAASEVAAAVLAGGGEAVICDSIADATQKARDYCGKNGRIVITGSFMTIADYLKTMPKPKPRQ